LYTGEEWDVTVMGSKTKVHQVNGGGDNVDWQTALYYWKKVLKNRMGKVTSTVCQGLVKELEGRLHLQPNPTAHQGRQVHRG
jgi:hypothetical protein